MTEYSKLRDGQKFYGNGYKQGYADAKKEFERPHRTDFCPNCGAKMQKGDMQ